MEMITRKIIVFALFVSMIPTISCYDQIFPLIDCENCLTEEPVLTQIRVEVLPSQNLQLFGGVIINVYEGDDTTGTKIHSYLPVDDNSTVDVAPNRTYTFEAIFKLDGRTYRTIDSARPAVKYSESECDEPCWYVYNNKVNLKLKYY
jgi:hypothetical protein